ncbi:hypothetical protein EMMF5_001762, partial [Cystobasidiomycetes sp. EMM_F5]
PPNVRLPPRSQYTVNGRSTTPYTQCKVRLDTVASDFARRIFKARIIDFTRLRLLGPLSGSHKLYHPQDSSAFNIPGKSRGRYPTIVPMQIQGERWSYNLRRITSTINDLEGFEEAVIRNAELDTRRR